MVKGGFRSSHTAKKLGTTALLSQGLFREWMGVLNPPTDEFKISQPFDVRITKIHIVNINRGVSHDNLRGGILRRQKNRSQLVH